MKASQNKPAKPGLVMGVVLLLALAGIYGAYRFALHQALRQRLAAIRAQGLPVLPSELDAWRGTVPAAENAAALYLEAFNAIQIPASELAKSLPLAGGSNLPAVNSLFAPDALAAMDAFIATNQQALVLLHQASQQSQCRFPIVANPVAVSAIPFVHSRYACQLLALAAIREAVNGQPTAALEKLQDGLALAEALRQEPLFVVQSMRVHHGQLLLSTLEQVCGRTALSEPALRQLSQSVAALDDPESLWRGLVGEQTLGGCLATSPTGAWRPDAGPLFALAGLREINLIRLLDQHAQQLRSARLPAEALWAETIAADRAAAARPCHRGPGHLLCDTALVSLSKPVRLRLRLTARVRAAQTALALLVFHLRPAIMGHGGSGPPRPPWRCWGITPATSAGPSNSRILYQRICPPCPLIRLLNNRCA